MKQPGKHNQKMHDAQYMVGDVVTQNKTTEIWIDTKPKHSFHNQFKVTQHKNRNFPLRNC